MMSHAIGRGTRKGAREKKAWETVVCRRRVVKQHHQSITLCTGIACLVDADTRFTRDKILGPSYPDIALPGTSATFLVDNLQQKSLIKQDTLKEKHWFYS